MRPARPEDLAAINAVITTAIGSWQLSERVKRLSLPLYHYTLQDLVDYHIEVAVDASNAIRALTAWGTCDPSEAEELPGSALLHGIFVHPDTQRRGLGREQLERVITSMRTAGYRAVLVKASKDAIPFFLAMGMTQLASAEHRYPYRFWYSLA